MSAGDTAWVLGCAALVLLMVPGLALFYGGLVRSRSSLNTMMMSVVALGVVGVQWVVFGYSLAFGRGGRWIGGGEWLGLAAVGGGADATYASTIPHLAFVAFQAMFAVITVALISGAVVERMRFRTYLLFALLWTTLIYDPLAHWVWGPGGWLKELGALDFAGGTVVHVSAGTSALVAALMLGPRRGFGRAAFLPHNVPMTLLGAGLLWFGWFGFNAGSALAADGIAATAFMATFAAPAAALLVWMALEMRGGDPPTAVGAATAMIVGLVAITPAAGYVTPLAAVVLGAVAAGAARGALHLRGRLRVDDSLDVFACHGVAGIVGALLTGVLATKAVNPSGADGLLAGHGAQLLVQLLAVLTTVAFAAAGTGVVLLGLRATAKLRVPLLTEIRGIDVGEHGEAAYAAGAVGVDAAPPELEESVLLPVTELVRPETAAVG